MSPHCCCIIDTNGTSEVLITIALNQIVINYVAMGEISCGGRILQIKLENLKSLVRRMRYVYVADCNIEL